MPIKTKIVILYNDEVYFLSRIVPLVRMIRKFPHIPLRQMKTILSNEIFLSAYELLTVMPDKSFHESERKAV
jgi:hypothetical protein